MTGAIEPQDQLKTSPGDRIGTGTPHRCRECRHTCLVHNRHMFYSIQRPLLPKICLHHIGDKCLLMSPLSWLRISLLHKARNPSPQAMARTCPLRTAHNLPLHPRLHLKDIYPLRNRCTLLNPSPQAMSRTCPLRTARNLTPRLRLDWPGISPPRNQCTLLLPSPHSLRSISRRHSLCTPRCRSLPCTCQRHTPDMLQRRRS